MGLLIAVTFQSCKNSPFEYCQEGFHRYTDQVPSEPHLAGALTLTIELDLSHPPESSRAAWGCRATRLSEARFCGFQKTRGQVGFGSREAAGAHPSCFQSAFSLARLEPVRRAVVHVL